MKTTLFDAGRNKELASRYPGLVDPPLSSRAAVLMVCAGLAAAFGLGLWWLDIDYASVWAGLGRLGQFTVLMFPPDPGHLAPVYLKSLFETLAISLLGTLAAALIAFPLGILAAANVMPVWPLRIGLRRFHDTLRSVDTLVWALIWINVVGLGPFAGVLAIACSDIGAFGKLFSETIESASKKGVEGVRSAGGSRLHELRFGLIPEVLPVMAGQVLYFFESNTRSASIIGIVGAGGIGLHLNEEIRTLEWQHVSFIILMILVAVALIDLVSSRLRAAIAGTAAKT